MRWIKTYDPPQLNGAVPYAGPLISCCTHRSQVCAKAPCCCAPMAQRCIGNLEYGKLSEPDDWFGRMLDVSNPNAPELMKGLYWMEDNIAPEVILSFQSGDWRADGGGVYINTRYNWSNDVSCWGTCCSFANCTGTPAYAWPFTLSPNRKFMNINPQWIYVLQPGDEIHRPDGTPVEFEPGDMMRLAFNDNSDPSSGLTYQYLVRKVAFKDGDGNLVKTKHYEELKHRALMPEPEYGCCSCFGFRWAWPSQETKAKLMKPLSDEQMFQIAPPLQQMWPDVKFSSS